MKRIKVYRVENEKDQLGLWRDFDGTWNPKFDMLSDGKCRDLPMPHSEIYGFEGKRWFSSAPTKESFKVWFSKKDIEELTENGFSMAEFEVSNWKVVSQYEYIFPRDAIISKVPIEISEIFN